MAPERGRLLVQLQLVQLAIRDFLLSNVLPYRLLIFAHGGHLVSRGQTVAPRSFFSDH